jgi:hypothetical protein
MWILSPLSVSTCNNLPPNNVIVNNQISSNILLLSALLSMQHLAQPGLVPGGDVVEMAVSRALTGNILGITYK